MRSSRTWPTTGAGCAEAFTEGRSVEAWLRHLYSFTQKALEAKGFEAPDFDTFWQRGELRLPRLVHDGGPIRAFRDDPVARPLSTASGRIEIFSETVAEFGYADCPGHPTWLPPADVVSSAHPLQLVANQPATRLHSQFDFGGHSAALKHRGREVARLHPADAAARGIAEGDIIKPVQRARRRSCGGDHYCPGHPRRRGATADRRLGTTCRIRKTTRRFACTAIPMC